jgi:hypothetical protein
LGTFPMKMKAMNVAFQLDSRHGRPVTRGIAD